MTTTYCNIFQLWHQESSGSYRMPILPNVYACILPGGA